MVSFSCFEDRNKGDNDLRMPDSFRQKCVLLTLIQFPHHHSNLLSLLFCRRSRTRYICVKDPLFLRRRGTFSGAFTYLRLSNRLCTCRSYDSLLLLVYDNVPFMAIKTVPSEVSSMKASYVLAAIAL